jgi:hypothetical protein
MLTAARLCYFATVVTVGILLGIVFGQPNANVRVK